jgi:hypothetical protein
MSRRVLPYPCHCGGKLVEVPIHVEYFGHDFGVRVGHACTRCGDEFLSEQTWQEVEDKAKELRVFGLERKVRIRKSGNSLVLTLPPEIAAYVGAKKDALASLVPTGQGSVEVEVLG